MFAKLLLNNLHVFLFHAKNGICPINVGLCDFPTRTWTGADRSYNDMRVVFVQYLCSEAPYFIARADDENF